MSLNLQYFSSYPEDKAAARQRLRKVVGVDTECAVDVIAVQEGIKSIDVFDELGYEKVACAGSAGVAQSVRQMVYDDQAALGGCPEALRDEVLCNQIYVQRGSDWQVLAHDVERVSSAISLDGGEGRCSGQLAMRSMVWVKLRRVGQDGPAAYVMCTHITGGRFEDQYFLQQLGEERREQPVRCAKFFAERRPQPHEDDVGVLIGDFNALPHYAPTGAMHSYFKTGIANSRGVQLDSERQGLASQAELEDRFKTYMTSPFMALKDLGWTLAYGSEVGPTSAFGHLIDHMALSRGVQVLRAEVQHLTNQKFSTGPPDTDLVLTDHNAVKVALEF